MASDTLGHAPLTDSEAARYLGLTPATLRASRLRVPRCDGPPYVRMGRAVRYHVADLDAWLTERRVVPAAMRPPSGEARS